MTLNELNEATTFSRRDFDIGDFAKPLEERSKFVLGDITRQPANEDSGIVRISELVHRLLLAISKHRLLLLLLHLLRISHLLLGWHHTAHHTSHAAAATTTTAHVTRATFVLGCRGRYPHRSITAVYALHLRKGSLLIIFVREANESVAS